jgi:hypothetical protein
MPRSRWPAEQVRCGHASCPFIGSRVRRAGLLTPPTTFPVAAAAGLSFRGNAKWLGLACTQVPGDLPEAPRELVGALSLSGHLFLMLAGMAAV